MGLLTRQAAAMLLSLLTSCLAVRTSPGGPAPWLGLGKVLSVDRALVLDAAPR